MTWYRIWIGSFVWHYAFIFDHFYYSRLAAGVRTMMRSAEEVQMKDTNVDSDDLSIKNKDYNDG